MGGDRESEGREGEEGASNMEAEGDNLENSMNITLAIDPEGGVAHMVDVIAHNTLKSIIATATERVMEIKGQFRLPLRIMDRLFIKCELVLLNYGETEAEKVIEKEILDYLQSVKAFKEKDNERKLKERLPEDTRRD